MFVQMRSAALQMQAIRQQARPAVLPQKKADPASLQNQKQQLQSQMLLLKATTQDGAEDVSGDLQDKLNARLKSIDAALRTAKSGSLSAPEQTAGQPASRSMRPSRDSYQRSAERLSPGIYQVKAGPGGYQVNFQPYREPGAAFGVLA